MKLLRLLSAGKSLDGSKDPVGRYRLEPGNALPHFGGAANPFRGATQPQDAPVQATSQAPKPTSSFPNPVCRADMPRRRNWLQKLISVFVPDKQAKRGPVFLASGVGKRAVQAELRLEQVRVVRNDLADSDLELVASRRRKASANPFKPAPEAGAAATQAAKVEAVAGGG